MTFAAHCAARRQSSEVHVFDKGTLTEDAADMPTVDENKREWDGHYSWNKKGDEWSGPWKTTELQWFSSLLPRIHAHIPTDTILELAPGYGRWTQYLKDFCNRLIVVDLSEECIEACKQRFASTNKIEYYVNDGKSLAMVGDASVGFAFSFDSLVHADASVMDAYIAQLSRILTDDGVAFLHHSNLGEYEARYTRILSVPKLRGLLITLGVLDPFLHWRDPGVSAASVDAMARSHGLTCISQEIVHWRTTKAMNDCMSTIVKRGSVLERSNRVLRNPAFMQEAENAARLSELYESRE